MKWDKVVDIVVVGSGAGGFTSALVAHDHGAETLVIEKSGKYGGSSAMSGGAIWIPGNQHMLKLGIRDSSEEGFEYLKHITRGEVEEDLLKAYAFRAKEMVSYLHDHSPMKFKAMPIYPDYYPEEYGGKSGGRSIEPVPFDGRKLREEFDRIRDPHPQELIFGRYAFTAVEAQRLASGGIRGMLDFAWVFLKYWLNFPARDKYIGSTRMTLGNGLISRLRYGLMERNVPVWLHSAAQELIEENGKVIGVRIRKKGKEMTIRTRKGVILAAGGFARNAEMRKAFQRNPITADWTSANPLNTGDAIKMGMKLGAGLGFMNDAWWTPTVLVEGDPLAWLLIIEKSLPRTMIVNKNGKRFTNEAAPYIDVINGMYDANAQSASIPAYIIFDAKYRRKYPMGPIMPGYMQPDWSLSDRLKENFPMKKADSIEELAQKLGIDPAGLVAEVKKFNQFAKEGKDPDFGRGDSMYDRYYGDPKTKPNACLGPLEKGPFYGVAVWPGDLGTKGGLTTNANGQVLKEDGAPIEGLYATGNCSASVMGPTYPGAGGTLGPAMTFGYLAALHLTTGQEKTKATLAFMKKYQDRRQRRSQKKKAIELDN